MKILKGGYIMGFVYDIEVCYKCDQAVCGADPDCTVFRSNVTECRMCGELAPYIECGNSQCLDSVFGKKDGKGCNNVMERMHR